MNFIQAYFNAFFNHELYHGWFKSKKFFEGWYFKIVSADSKHAYAFIPGIAMDNAGKKQAFVQVLDGKGYTATYHSFPADTFQPNPKSFLIKVGENSFSLDSIHLHLSNIQGEIHFTNHFLWPKKMLAPGIMGWYAFVPFMECYHQVISMNFCLKGALHIGNSTIDFTNGKGYLEKDWGHSFPEAWIWMQSNHFNSDTTSFKLSVAKIPWLRSHFIGFISAFLIEGKLYRFATYTGAKLTQVNVSDEAVFVELIDKKYKLQVTAHKAEGDELAVPILGFMDGRVKESMDATLQVILIDRKSNAVMFNDRGVNAGLEVAGNIQEILNGYKKH